MFGIDYNGAKNVPTKVLGVEEDLFENGCKIYIHADGFLSVCGQKTSPIPMRYRNMDGCLS